MYMKATTRQLQIHFFFHVIILPLIEWFHNVKKYRSTVWSLRKVQNSLYHTQYKLYNWVVKGPSDVLINNFFSS